MKNDKTKLSVMKIIAAAFAALLVLFWISIFLNEMRNGIDMTFVIVTLIPLIAIIAILFMFVKRHSDSVKSGMPLKDERTLMLEGRAGHYTFIATMWFLVGLMWYETFIRDFVELPEILGRHIVIIVLLFMAVAYGSLRFYFGKKGE